MPEISRFSHRPIRVRARVKDCDRKRIPKACQRCKSRKSRCIVPISSSPSPDRRVTCERCARISAECIFPSDHVDGALAAQPDASTISPSPSSGAQRAAPTPPSRPTTIISSRAPAISQRQDTGRPTQEARLFVRNPHQTHYAGEVSNRTFLLQIQDAVNGAASTTTRRDIQKGYIVFPGLSTIDNSVLSTVHEAFPPMNVAEFLVQVFFHTVEANSYFMDRERFSTRLEKLYDSTGQSPRISTDGSGDDVEVDPSFLCLSLLVFALGSQFAEMQIPDQSITPPPSLSRPPPGDDPGMVFYQKAKLLLPDMLTQCSLESMQACFLMGLFLLPSNVSDLSCVYHGMALKMAIAAGLHRKVSGHDLDARLIQVRNRLWWSLYVSDRRLAIVLDHPESIREEDIDAPLPESHPQLDVLPIGDNNLANLQADIALTKIFNNVVWVRKTVGFESTDAGSYIDAIKRSLTGWLDDLPWHLQLSNLDPDMQSFRGAVQLHMSYNLIIIHMGRKCLLNHIQQHLQGHYDQSNGSQTHPKARRHRGSDEIPMTPVHGPTDRPRYSSHSRNSPGRGTIGNDQLPQMNKMEKALIRDCVSAAFEIIKLVSYLSETGKLARCSFADLSCCGTAGIIIMIHDIIKHHPLYRSSMQTMLNAMEHMAAGCHKACNSLGLIQQLRTVITEVKRKMAAASAATQKKQGDTEDRNYEASHENPGLKIPTEVGYQDWRRWMAMRGADDSSASEIWTDQYAIQTPDHSLVGVTGHVNRNPPGSEIGASRPSAEVVRHAEQEFSDGDDVAAMGGPHLEFAPGYPGTEGQVQYNTYTWPANLSSLGLSGFEDLEFPVF